ncbi:MAG: membrane dipeptidase [Clostridiales bacterium]|nr:membrane dipeptidase [Clostridiales bacterium]
MYIADTHSDTLFAMGLQPNAPLMITPERLRSGGVTLQVCALWTGPKGNKGDVDAIVSAELAAMPRLIEAGVRKVDDPADAIPGESCFMLSIEGGEVFEKGIHTVEEWRARGVRMAALLWNNENALGYAAKSGDQRGLTAYGLQVAREMQRVGMAVDVSHLNEAGFYDLFAKTNKPPMASHSCCRKLCDHFRNLTDEQLRLMIREGGFVGVNFYPHFLSEDGKADAALIARHIDHICQLGGAGIVGFGSDFDGIEVTPADMNHPGEIPNLLQELRKLGYDDAAIAGIAGENLLTYFKRIA